VTEAEWLTSNDPEPMLELVRSKASGRKLRLLAATYARHRFGELDPVGVAERYADGLADDRELSRACSAADWYVLGNCSDIQGEVPDSRDWSLRDAAYHDAADAARSLVWYEQDARRLSEQLGVRPQPSPLPDLLRDLFGNPFRPSPRLGSAWLAWNGGTVPRMAQAIYEDRILPSGELDRRRLAVLADALEDAGCSDPDLLGHLRGPGPHVRGCWAVDLLLGKE
jgi:hypothetical protein